MRFSPPLCVALFSFFNFRNGTSYRSFSGRPFLKNSLFGKKRISEGAEGVVVGRPKLEPKTHNQQLYLNHLNNPNISVVLALGPAGTGKTLFACDYAIKSLMSGSHDKIIITRPVISVDEELGFLPGDLNKKMDPFTRPLFDIFLQYISQKKIDEYLYLGKIEISPLAFMRGRTFKNSFIIADEMQNSSPNQMLMLSTRLGDNSKMVITGDLHQSDRHQNNGLSDILKKINYYQGCNEGGGEFSRSIKTMVFEKTDVQRSPIVSDILNIYHFFDNNSTAAAAATPTTTPAAATPFMKNNDCAMIPASEQKYAL